MATNRANSSSWRSPFYDVDQPFGWKFIAFRETLVYPIANLLVYRATDGVS